MLEVLMRIFFRSGEIARDVKKGLKLMATVNETLEAFVASSNVAFDKAGASVANIAGDLARLIADIQNGTVQPATLVALTEVQAHAQALAESLEVTAAIVPEPETPPPPPPVV